MDKEKEKVKNEGVILAKEEILKEKESKVLHHGKDITMKEVEDYEGDMFKIKEKITETVRRMRFPNNQGSYELVKFQEENPLPKRVEDVEGLLKMHFVSAIANIILKMKT